MSPTLEMVFEGKSMLGLDVVTDTCTWVYVCITLPIAMQHFASNRNTNPLQGMQFCKRETND